MSAARRLRVAQLLPAMHGGGVERGVLEVSRALAAAGHESVVVSAGGGLCERLRAEGGAHERLNCGGKNPLTAPWRAWRLRRLLGRLRPHVVHVRSRAPAWLLFLATRAGGKKFAVVSTMHGLYSPGKYAARMTDADRIICVSRASLHYTRQHYNPPEEKLRLIHRGVDFSYFSPSKTNAQFCAEFVRQHNLRGRFVVLLAGRFSALKGHALFLRALARARAAAPQTPWLALFVGDGKRLQSAKALAQELQVPARFVGAQSEMREVYSVSDLLVSASLTPEAFGRTVTEALAMETPVVAPAFGGALDIVQDGVNGALYAPKDEAALAAALVAAAGARWQNLRQSVAQFSLSHMTSQTLALYDEVAPR